MSLKANIQHSPSSELDQHPNNMKWVKKFGDIKFDDMMDIK
jgi:hypothetical protein